MESTPSTESNDLKAGRELYPLLRKRDFYFRVYETHKNGFCLTPHATNPQPMALILQDHL